MRKYDVERKLAHFPHFCSKNLLTLTISIGKQKASVASEINHFGIHMQNFKKFGETGFEKSRTWEVHHLKKIRIEKNGKNE